MKTLIEYAKGLGDDNPARPLIEMFAQKSDILSALPFEGLTGAVYEGYRQSALPSPGFRAIGEASTSGTGKITPFQEASFIVDHDLDVDRAIVDRYGPVRRAREETMAAAAAGKLWTNTFLKGDNSTNPRLFNGLQSRCGVFGRKLDNSSASGGAALSLLNLDKAINNTHEPTHIIADYTTQPLWIQAARNTSLSGFVMQTWDQVGSVKMSYANLPILWGYGKDDQGSILPFTEVGAGGGSAVTTSFYVVSIKDGGLKGIQIKPLTFQDMGLLQDGITYRTHMSWDCSIVDENKYCMTRLTSITNAAFVA
jgi:hypothetical protein